MSESNPSTAVVYHYDEAYRNFIGEAARRAGYVVSVSAEIMPAYTALSEGAQALIIPTERLQREGSGPIKERDPAADLRGHAKDLKVPRAEITSFPHNPPIYHSTVMGDNLWISTADPGAATLEECLAQAENLSPEKQATIANALTTWLLRLPVKER